ncbi:MAG: antirestriction protein [Alphaproteobacteria bacterium]|nr:MAG: antirestriction protein [Alphaproteobacteria bacterium]
MNNEIRIYVACLAAYNGGRLHGVWIDATGELEEIQEQVNVMLKESPEPDAEEWAIHDYEGFGGYGVSEYSGFEELHNAASFIEEYPEIGGELLEYFSDIEEATKAAEENYCGCYKSMADYAEELTEETSQIPEHLQYYIDYEKMGRDMELNGDVFTIETGYEEVHIFWNN